MRTTQLSVMLPLEMAARVRAKVVSGEYISESEAIRDALRALLAREMAVEAWLLNAVVPDFDALQSDVARAKAINDVRAAFAAEHGNAIKARRAMPIGSCLHQRWKPSLWLCIAHCACSIPGHCRPLYL